MNESVFWIIATFSLAAFAGPFAFLATKTNTVDPADLYLVMAIDRNEVLAVPNVSEVGPQNAPLAVMINAPAAARSELILAGYLLLPVGALAALCGVQTDPQMPLPRKT